MSKKLSKEELARRVNESGYGRYKFVRWYVDGEYGTLKKCVVRCVKDGFEWAASVSHLVNNSRGCPQCSGKRRWTADERVSHINSLENIEFVSWISSYKNQYSKANVRCAVDGFEWSATVNNLVNACRGCPSCAGYGFQIGKIGYLYALRSECGRYVKIGISNKPSQRHRQLELSTPFKFNLVEQIAGDGAKIAELEKHFHNKYERAGFTGFDGCTEWLMCTPQLLEELRELEDVK